MPQAMQKLDSWKPWCKAVHLKPCSQHLTAWETRREEGRGCRVYRPPAAVVAVLNFLSAEPREQ